MSHPRGWPKHRLEEHVHEDCPPHQGKAPNAGDDNWGLHVTSLAVDNDKVSSEKNDALAATARDTKFMRPVYGEGDSYAIHHSRTNGKG